MFDKKTQFAILKKNINLGGLIADQLDLALEPALDKVVADTANPFDDMLKAAVYPTLREELQKLIEKHVNGIFDVEEND
jgi:hypothetical protein